MMDGLVFYAAVVLLFFHMIDGLNKELNCLLVFILN